MIFENFLCYSRCVSGNVTTQVISLCMNELTAEICVLTGRGATRPVARDHSIYVKGGPQIYTMGVSVPP